jgi:RNA polymerase sigma-70 factor (ECF subfamily)
MDTASASQEMDDSLLLAQLRAGQAGAYERLMRRYNRRLFRAARGIVADDAEAQDAVQEGYLRAFVALQGFRGESSLGTWLTRIVINQALSQQRKLGRIVLWGAAPEEEEDPAMPSREDPESAIPGSESPEQALLQRQLREQLQHALDGLPPIYRSVVMLRAVEGLSVQECADCLSVSPEVVKTRYLRARALLRESLAPTPLHELPRAHDFQAQRCDDLVAAVLARMRALGLIRDH